MRNVIHKMNKKIVMFFIILIAIAALVIPLYCISYNAVNERINSDVKYRMQFIVDSIESEEMIRYRIAHDLAKDTKYIHFKNLQSFDEVKQHIVLKNFYDLYKKRVDIFSYSTDTFLFVRNTDTVISRNRMFYNMKDSFDNLMSFNSMSYEEFKKYIFSIKNGFNQILFKNASVDGEKGNYIISIQPVEQRIGGEPISVIMSIYSLDDMFTKIYDSDYEDVFEYFAVNNDTVLGKETMNSDSVSVAYSSSIGLKLSYAVSEAYSIKYMRDFRLFAYVYITFLLLCVVIFELLILWYSGKSVRNMAHFVANLTENDSIRNENDIMDIFVKLNSENENYDKYLFLSAFSKPPEKEECDFIRKKYPNFPEPFLFVSIFCDDINSVVMETIADKMGVDKEFIFFPAKNEGVLFVPYNDDFDIILFKEKLDKINFAAKKQSLLFTALISIPCESITEFYDMHKYLLSYYRFIDYEGVFKMEIHDNKASQDYSNDKSMINLENSVATGNAAEAKKIVYQQWYDIMTSANTSDSDIEKLFYNQIFILEGIANKIQYNRKLVTYDNKFKINELAFLVADEINAICEVINLSDKVNIKHKKLIEYIDGHFTDMDFCLTYLEDKFSLSGKTINMIVKSCTGDTFSEYVEKNRLELVKKMMVDSDEDIKIISQKCGYQNYDTFYKFFKKHMGVSPAKWRRAYKK